LLDHVFLIRIISIVTIAGNGLAPTDCATLNFTADDVKLPLLDCAVTTWLTICTEVLCLLAVTNPIVLSAIDDNKRL